MVVCRVSAAEVIEILALAVAATRTIEIGCSLVIIVGFFRQTKYRRPEGRRRVDARAVSGCRGAGSSVELRDHKGYGNKRDGGSNQICLHVAEPRQCLHAGVTQEENHHQSNNQLVHVCLRYHLLCRWLYHRWLATVYPCAETRRRRSFVTDFHLDVRD